MGKPKKVRKDRNKSGGCYAFFLTLRPRHGITDDCIERCRRFKAHMPLQYELFVIEKEGEARHAHWFIFPKTAQQRSNVIKQVTKWCLACEWDDDSIANFKKWDATRIDGAAKTCTNMDFVKYVDGTYESKTEDYFEVVWNTLPDDLNECEKWMPGVGELKRRPNARFHTLLAQMQEHFNLPDRGKMKASLNLLQRMLFWLENNDIREANYTPTAKAFIKKFYQWYNHYDHDDSYHPACRHEIDSIDHMLADELDDNERARRG